MRALASDPLQVFSNEFQRAQDLKIPQPEAMSLATVDSNGQPSVRTVLFKGLKHGGFCFYTNYESPKALHILKNPKISLLFHWTDLQQQVRIEGEAQQLTRSESEEYFQTRPRLSQVGAWASRQSEKIESLNELEFRVTEIEKKYQGQGVPCPPHWGGFCLRPRLIEFWYGREGRLHERYVYERAALDSAWSRSMKSP